MHVTRLAGALALACLLAAAPTFAHAAEVDITPIASYGLDLLFGVLGAVAVAGLGILAALIKKKTGIDLAILQDRDNATLHSGIGRIVDALEVAFRDQLFGADGRVVVNVDNPAVAAGAKKYIERSPDLLKRMGVTEDRLKELVAERLNTSGGYFGTLVAGEALTAPAMTEFEVRPTVDLSAIDAAIKKVGHLDRVLRDLPQMPAELPDPEAQTDRLTRAVRQAPPLPAGVAASGV